MVVAVVEASTCPSNYIYPSYFAFWTDSFETPLDTFIENFFILDDLSVVSHLRTQSL